VKSGRFSKNVFYRMQALHEKNREVYILFTRWGRIGENGQYQQTPFGSKEECIKEFCKIFKEKSGNTWENKEHFEKKVKKYQLLKFVQKPKVEDFVKEIDFEYGFHQKR